MEKSGWKKSSPELVELFERVFPGPPAEARKMFGYPAAFVNGNMFMGLFEDNFYLRLSEQDREELLAGGGERLAPMGRPMKEYVVVPEGLAQNRKQLEGWVDRSLAYAAGLPPKAKKDKR